jgi:hypothetical protein
MKTATCAIKKLCAAEFSMHTHDPQNKTIILNLTEKNPGMI